MGSRMATPSSIPPLAAERPSPSRSDNLHGIFWMLASVVGASAMTVAVRELSATLDPRMIVALRACVTLIAFLVAVPFFRGLRRLSFSRPWLHAARGALIALATMLGFYTLAHLPLATATVLFFTAPIFATLLSMAVHRERVGIRRASAVAAGFTGALIILQPGLQPLNLAMLAALGSSVMFATALTLSRGLVAADGAPAAYVSSVVVTVLISMPVAAPVWALPGTLVAGFALVVMVLGGALRGYADIEAYAAGEAAVLAPIAYLRLVLIGIAGFVLYDEVPGPATMLGAMIIVGATLYITWREHQLRRAALAKA